VSTESVPRSAASPGALRTGIVLAVLPAVLDIGFDGSGWDTVVVVSPSSRPRSPWRRWCSPRSHSVVGGVAQARSRPCSVSHESAVRPPCGRLDDVIGNPCPWSTGKVRWCAVDVLAPASDLPTFQESP